MNLAAALRGLATSREISALGYLNHGRPYYVALLHEGKHIVLESPAILTGRKLRVPFDLRGMDDATRELVAIVAKGVDWTLFRGGVPIEGP